ncbi:hypothetical protein KEM55_001587 [Ascosphaera atra]|nr:hypothetical protein KEM55_001587 [Ascosphaera atra]
MLFLIRRQRYLELLEKRNLHAALLLLQRKLTPLGPGNEELHRLSKLLVCSPEVVRRKLGWRGSLVDTRRALLTHLLKRVSASSMIPERRLATLFDYVKQNQVYHCYYHNTTDPISLLTDHRCDLSTFPTCESRVLEHHRDEVWFVAFSPDGKKLVTTGHDSDIYIYHVPYFDMYRRLTGGHSQSVVHAAWSPDCTKIVTCSKDHSAVLWDLEVSTFPTFFQSQL